MHKSRCKLSIIILSFNVEKLLLSCLKSVKAEMGDEPWEIIVSDNLSSDNSVAAVRANFPGVKVIENGKNLGFSAGNNVAIKKSVGEYVLLLNPDTIIHKNSIRFVLNYLQQHPDVGAATCRVELPDGSLDYSCHRGFPNPLNSFMYFFTRLPKVFPQSKFFSSYQATQYDLSAPHQIDALTGAYAMVRRTAGDRVGWLDEDYFWNGEDLDFCYKLYQAGSRIMFLPQVKITHYKGSSSGLAKTAAARPSRTSRIRSALSGTSAMRIFYTKHLASKYSLPLNLLVYTGIHTLTTVRYLKARFF